MAQPNLFIGGLGGTSGSTLATLSPLQITGDAWYVKSTTGTDDVSPAGKERSRPLATVGQAYTNAAAGDWIVMLSGHAETLAVQLTLAKAGLTLLGEGIGTARPQLTRSGDANALFSLTAAGIRLDNLYFPARGGEPLDARIHVAASEVAIANCYFVSNEVSYPTIELVTGANSVRITDTYLVSPGTTPASAPHSAIKVTNAVSDLWITGCTIDGAASGWRSATSGIALAAAVTRLRAYNNDMLGDTDMNIATGTSGFVHVRNKSGSARVVWAT